MPPATSSTARRLFALARAHGWLAAGLVLAAGAGTALVLVFPAAVRRLLDEALPAGDTALAWRCLLAAGAAFAARDTLAWLRIRLNGLLEQRLSAELRRRLHDHLLLLPMPWFDRHPAADTLTRLAEDAPAAQKAVVESAEQGVTALLQALAVMVMMLVLEPLLALLVLLPVPVIAAGGWFYSRAVAPRARAAREAAGDLNNAALESVAGIRVVKTHEAAAWRRGVFAAAAERFAGRQLRLNSAWAFYAAVMSLLGAAGLLLLMAPGAFWAIEGRVSPGLLMQFVLLTGFLYEPIARLHGVNQTLAAGLAAAARVFSVLDEEPEREPAVVQPGEKTRATGRAEQSLVFEGVIFGHRREGEPALRGVDLTIRSGEIAALAGASGSGKSTLLHLALGFYQPWKGRVLFGGLDTARQHLRGRAAWVGQDPFLFDASLRDNLRAGLGEAPDDRLWEALEMVGAARFVRDRAGGLDAPAGERGSRLSGGERQRLALARAVLRDPELLLLDEPSSALDEALETEIWDRLEPWLRQRTSLLVAHRPATVRRADRVHVLRDGVILDSGGHEELAARCPHYSALMEAAGPSQRGSSIR
jgi:ABC-type multidrug transport system fused ATPase/permease subunit